MTPWDVVVVGAGAAGILAATEAAKRHQRVLLLEKNSQPGVKILMSGGTRCNITHAAQPRDIVAAFGRQGRFLHSALAALSPADVVRLVEEEGVPTKVEPGGKIFPVSDRAADVLEALLARLRRSDAILALDEPLISITRTGGGFTLQTSRRTLKADKVILASGGKSYPKCGTSGDGYAWARALGHAIVTPRPALTPIAIPAEWVRDLKGLAVDDAAVEVVPKDGGAALDCRRGAILFTHFGLSGPAILDVSRAVSALERPSSVELVCDFAANTTREELHAWLRDIRTTDGRRRVGGLLAERAPKRLAAALTRLAEVDAAQPVAELSTAAQRRLVEQLKATPIVVEGALGFRKAEVTAGGVPLEEVDSRTMQSRLTPNLYVIGELLDLDGPIGGYNFQAAFSTGALAGQRV